MPPDGPQTLSELPAHTGLLGLEGALASELERHKIHPVDAETLHILTYAARLVAGPGTPSEISIARLFLGIVHHGSAAAVNSYPELIATAIGRNRALQHGFHEIDLLFKEVSAETVFAALSHNRTWFQKDVLRILTKAAERREDLPFSDALARELLQRVPTPHGLLYQSIAIRALRSDVAKLEDARKEPQTLRDEIINLLAELRIPATPPVVSILLRAAGYRGTSSQIEMHHVARELLLGEPGVTRRPDSPSHMLAESIDLESTAHALRRTDIPIPTAETPIVPQNPVKFATALVGLLNGAYSKQQTCFLNTALGTKGLVAAILTMPPEQRIAELDRYELPFNDALARFRDLFPIRLAERPDQLQQWNSAFDFAAMGRPRVASDQPARATRDRLGIDNDALAIANVAAGRTTSLPLAFGIFGDWGAGKTFFMNRIRAHIASVVDSHAKDDNFEHAIVQIQFNAWHYAETNLWASLVSHIFEELDRWMTRQTKDSSEGNTEARQAVDKILTRLSTSRQLTLEAATELVQRRKEHTAAGNKLSQAQQKLIEARESAAHAPVTVWCSAVKVARDAINHDANLKQHLGDMESKLGLPELLGDKAKLIAALEELNRTASAGRATLGALQATIGSGWTVTLAITALIGVPALLYALPKVVEDLLGWTPVDLGRQFETFGGFLTMAAVLVRSFARRTRLLTNQFTKLKIVVDSEIARATALEHTEMLQALAKVAQTQTEVDKAKTVLQATGDQVVSALKDYSEETGSQRILRFVRARVGSDGYGKHLGLVSAIRRDFEQLEALMLPVVDGNTLYQLEQARRQYESRVRALIASAGGELEEPERDQLLDTAKGITDAKPAEARQFRRIILFIDDLDRCEPDKVVEVLQAVNMLLSFRLFVVMVAVDARWLSRSLETHYPDFFGSQNGQGNGRDEQDKVERATPADYLEKIFQIPYWVSPMTAQTSKALVSDLIVDDLIEDDLRPSALFSRRTSVTNNGATLHSDLDQTEAPAEDEQPQELASPGYPLGLTGNEIDALTRLSPFVGGSPRRARRFVNVYRVTKASLTPAEVTELERGGYSALATQLAIATGAPNAFSSWIELCDSNRPEPISDCVAELGIDNDEYENIVGALKVYTDLTGSGSDNQQKLMAQVARASRFSFAVPRKDTVKIVEPTVVP
ncbi:MAG TPA: P-loop NTPase fold protein [Xanthobacteraceae bacterium]|nr:P-loop NTPase fold protein [Xanthobacteraceae bacterium]